jgi:hypothetical protein
VRTAQFIVPTRKTAEFAGDSVRKENQMSVRTVYVLIGLCMVAPSVGARDLDDVAVKTAIQAGQGGKFAQWISECEAGPGKDRSSVSGQPNILLGGYRVVISTNSGHIALLAAEASRLQKPFDIADVPERLRSLGVYVFVDSLKPITTADRVYVPTGIDRVVLSSKTDPSSVAQSEAFEAEEVEWEQRGIDRTALAVAQHLGIRKSRATAMFLVASLKAVSAGDLDILVHTKAGDRRCTVRTRDRLRLFP